jgi:hypothetical protein
MGEGGSHPASVEILAVHSVTHAAFGPAAGVLHARVPFVLHREPMGQKYLCPQQCPGAGCVTIRHDQLLVCEFPYVEPDAGDWGSSGVTLTVCGGANGSTVDVDWPACDHITGTPCDYAAGDPEVVANPSLLDYAHCQDASGAFQKLACCTIGGTKKLDPACPGSDPNPPNPYPNCDPPPPEQVPHCAGTPPLVLACDPNLVDYPCPEDGI